MEPQPLEHEIMAEERRQSVEEKAREAFAMLIQLAIISEVGPELTETALEALPEESRELATALLSRSQRLDTPEVPGAIDDVRGALSRLGAPRKAKRVTEAIEAFLTGYLAGQI